MAGKRQNTKHGILWSGIVVGLVAVRLLNAQLVDPAAVTFEIGDVRDR